MKSAIKKDKSTPEKAGFWNCVEAAADQIQTWPEWKKEILSATIVHNSKTELVQKRSASSEKSAHRTRK